MTLENSKSVLQAETPFDMKRVPSEQASTHPENHY